MRVHTHTLSLSLSHTHTLDMKVVMRHVNDISTRIFECTDDILGDEGGEHPYKGLYDTAFKQVTKCSSIYYSYYFLIMCVCGCVCVYQVIKDMNGAKYDEAFRRLSDAIFDLLDSKKTGKVCMCVCVCVCVCMCRCHL